MGSVQTLIVWENLEINRYVLKDHSNDGKVIEIINMRCIKGSYPMLIRLIASKLLLKRRKFSI